MVNVMDKEQSDNLGLVPSLAMEDYVCMNSVLESGGERGEGGPHLILYNSHSCEVLLLYEY